MENNHISDGQISASSELNGNHKANQGRLYYTADGGKGGAWSAKTTDKNPWLQIDLGGLYATVTAGQRKADMTRMNGLRNTCCSTVTGL